MADLPEREEFEDKREQAIEKISAIDTEAFAVFSTRGIQADDVTMNTAYTHSYRYQDFDFANQTALAMLLMHFKLVGENIDVSKEELAQFCIDEYESADL